MYTPIMNADKSIAHKQTGTEWVRGKRKMCNQNGEKMKGERYKLQQKCPPDDSLSELEEGK